MMIVKNYEYNEYIIEIHEHPIYHDFEFVVKSSDSTVVKGASNHAYEHMYDCEIAAQIFISNL